MIMNASYAGIPTLQLLYLQPESNQKQPSEFLSPQLFFIFEYSFFYETDDYIFPNYTGDLVPFHIVHVKGAPGLPDIPGAGEIKLREGFVPITMIECVTRTMVRVMNHSKCLSTPNHVYLLIRIMFSLTYSTTFHLRSLAHRRPVKRLRRFVIYSLGIRGIGLEVNLKRWIMRG